MADCQILLADKLLGVLPVRASSVRFTHSTAPGDTVGSKDAATGTLTSKPFTIERNYRTFLNTSILATSTAYRFGNGRFWGWEGVGCCVGTCTQVWHYAQAMARLFPEIERDTRERVDLGLAFNAESGVMGFRAEFDRGLAVDGQAGTLLRMYRENQMTNDGSFLKRNWARIRQAFDPLLRLDADQNGILEGAQMNTLDQPWFGEIAWLSSLYLAALRAGEEMAKEMGDDAFAQQCRDIFEKGRRNVDAKLFNGEYYFQRADAAHVKTVGSHDGCEIGWRDWPSRA